MMIRDHRGRFLGKVNYLAGVAEAMAAIGAFALTYGTRRPVDDAWFYITTADRQDLEWRNPHKDYLRDLNTRRQKFIAAMAQWLKEAA